MVRVAVNEEMEWVRANETGLWNTSSTKSADTACEKKQPRW
jgi:hypothetical protein